MSIKAAIIRDLVYYMNEHKDRRNQQLHYAAFLFAFIGWIFMFISLWGTLFCAILHYVLAWVGHFRFEGNKPASFRYPWVGFYSGFIWFFIKTYELISGKQLLIQFYDTQAQYKKENNLAIDDKE